MNWLNSNRWSLNLRFFMGFMFLGIMPIFVWIILNIASTQDVLTDTRSQYIQETGNRRATLIEENLLQVDLDLNAFLNVSENAERSMIQVLTSFAEQGRSVSARTSAEFARQTITQDLLFNDDERLLLGAYMFTPDGDVVVTANLNALERPISIDNVAETGIFLSALSILNIENVTSELVFSERDNEQKVELLYKVTDGDDVLGFLVLSLNIDTVFLSALETRENDGDLYSFLILPTNDRYFATDEVVADDLVSFESIGVQRAIDRASSIPATYFTGIDTVRREVIGYSEPVTFLNKRMILMVEENVEVIDSLIVNNLLPTTLPIIFLITISSIVFTIIANRGIIPPLRLLSEGLNAITRNDFSIQLPARNYSELFRDSMTQYNQMRLFLLTANNETQATLQQRSRDLMVTQDIARFITDDSDLQELMDNVIYLIVTNFSGIYHAQIFLTDHSGMAVLRASTGEPGQALLQRGHRLEIGSVSVIGQVVEQNKTIIARDTAVSDIHRQNEFLPDTRAELAIPLQVGRHIIGALDVQSKDSDSFSPAQVEILETIASQISLAIENRRLVNEYQAGDYVPVVTTPSWKNYLPTDEKTVVQAGNQTTYDFDVLRRAVWNNQQAVVGDETPRNTMPFAVPIRLRNQILGVVAYEIPSSEFRYDKVLLAEELVSRLALSLDNARLFQESQESAERERVVNEIAARITGETDIDSILNIAISEIQQALQVSEVGIRLATGDETPNANGVSPNGDGDE